VVRPGIHTVTHARSRFEIDLFGLRNAEDRAAARVKEAEAARTKAPSERTQIRAPTIWIGIGCAIAGYVGATARHRGRSWASIAWWLVATVLFWPVVLPAYLLIRRRWGSPPGPRSILVFVGRKDKLLEWAAKELQRQPAVTYTVKGGEPAIETREK